MKKGEIYAGLDVGSTAVRIVIGQRNEDEGGFKVIGATSVPAEGINKGMVTSIENATSSISACLEKAERLAGVPIDSAWINVNDSHIKCELSKGVIAVGKSDGEIGDDDVARAVDAAGALSVPPNYEILHVLPSRFSVDNQEDIKDPVGMSGVRLEVEALIIQGLSTHLKNLAKAVHRTGLEIEDLVLSPLATASACLSSKQKDLGVAIVNIGASTTGLAVYEEGELLHSAVLPIGSEHITSDIAIGLRCPISLAEKIKIEYGSADPSRFHKKDEVDVDALLEGEEVSEDLKKISQKYLSEIIEARVEEIFEKIDAELRKIDRSGMLPAGVFLAGNGSLLTDLVEVGKKKLRLPVAIGSAKDVDIIIDKVNSPEFLTALGLVVWGDKNSEHKKSFMKKMPGLDFLPKIWEKIKKGVGSLMP